MGSEITLEITRLKRVAARFAVLAALITPAHAIVTLRATNPDAVSHNAYYFRSDTGGASWSSLNQYAVAANSFKDLTTSWTDTRMYKIAWSADGTLYAQIFGPGPDGSLYEGTYGLGQIFGASINLANDSASNILAAFALFATNGALVASGYGILNAGTTNTTTTNSVTAAAVFTIAYQSTNGNFLDHSAKTQTPASGKPEDHFPPGHQTATNTYIVVTRKR